MNNTMMIRNPQTNEWEPVYLPPTGDTFPIGAYAFIAGEQTPTNWLRCDGQAVSRTEYADLFNAIGTTYGAGDGSTTFNLPNVNLENRTLVGSSGDGEFSLGNTMGEKEIKLELENYIYGVYTNDDKNEKNDISAMFAPTGNNYGLGSVYVSNKNEPHNNMQPSIASICIIKAKQSVGIVGTVTEDMNDTNDNAVPNAKTTKEYIDNKFNFNVIDDLDIGAPANINTYKNQLSKAKLVIFALSYSGNQPIGGANAVCIPGTGMSLYLSDYASMKGIYACVHNDGEIETSSYNYDGSTKIKRIFYL